MNINTKIVKRPADIVTPVALLYKLREKYSEVLLLESSEYASKENTYSFLCCEPLSTIEVIDGQLEYKNFVTESTKTIIFDNLVEEMENYVNGINIEGKDEALQFNGIFGYTTFDAVKYFDKNLYIEQKPGHDIPDLKYGFYKFIIVIDHVSDKMIILENIVEGQDSKMDGFLTTINRQDFQTFDFKLTGEEELNMSDQDFKDMVTNSKKHCHRGNVFQIVPSRRYGIGYTGDDINVYRKLRSINPSPYLFYFDYGNFRIFGSSPEAQMIVKDRVAEIHPIAGTVKRTGDPEKDAKQAQILLEDKKENAEHIMLVDLARNDLSKNTDQVKLTKYREIQKFSHVIHLVSKVKGKLKDEVSAIQIFADTFPAGTLSGAPKYKAIQLIDGMEPTKRGFYGGAIGMINFNGDLNHAIIIRSVLSKDKKLFLQAGAGIVIDSKEESELQEVNNKLAALKAAIESANINIK